MRSIIYHEFSVGQVVYHKCGEGSIAGVVVSMRVFSGDAIAYGVAWGDRTDTVNFECELTSEKPAEVVP